MTARIACILALTKRMLNLLVNFPKIHLQTSLDDLSEFLSFAPRFKTLVFSRNHVADRCSYYS